MAILSKGVNKYMYKLVFFANSIELNDFLTAAGDTITVVTLVYVPDDLYKQYQLLYFKGRMVV